MTLLDTCTLIFDALAPEQLSRRARMELEKGRESSGLACCDISLWEIAMLMSKGRLKASISPRELLADIIAANNLRVLPINPQIAFDASHHPELVHGDPADRIIAATAIHHKALLLTCDRKLLKVKAIKTAW